MISINGNEKEFALDLNQSTQTVYELNVLSVDENDSKLPWKYDFISSPNISLEPVGLSDLRMKFNLSEIKSDEYFTLINSRKETLKVIVKPNIEMSKEKDYRFRISKYSSEGKDLTVKIVSRENGKYTPWHINYDGRPLKYFFTPKAGTGDTEMCISLRSTIYTAGTSMISIKQDNSGLCLQLKLRFPNNDTVILDDIIEGCNL